MRNCCLKWLSKMSRFLANSVGWLRRSLSEHETLRGPTEGGGCSTSTAAAASKRLTSSFDEEAVKISAAQSFAKTVLEEIDFTPELIGGPSEILDDDDDPSIVDRLAEHFPSRIVGSDWNLTFSTTNDGFSLGSVYRRLENSGISSPCLLLIESTDGEKFGALVSEAFRIQESFYGNGQSFLFTLSPEFRVWPWASENDYFVSGSPTALYIGAGDGRFGLVIDGDLNLGRTQSCATYNNQPLASKEDFVIKTLEIWTFV